MKLYFDKSFSSKLDALSIYSSTKEIDVLSMSLIFTDVLFPLASQYVYVSPLSSKESKIIKSFSVSTVGKAAVG